MAARSIRSIPACAPADRIRISGARVNNLKNVSVDLPRGQMTVVTGLSGSGKSSLAFDVIYAESNRRFLESLSTHARSVMGVLTKPDVDKIENISPAIAIDQKSVSKSVRSTVGTMTEIYDYVRILFAMIGIPHCPETGQPLHRKSTRDIMRHILRMPAGTAVTILAPLAQSDRKNSTVLAHVATEGFMRVRVDGVVMPVAQARQQVNDAMQVRVDVVVDHFVHDPQTFDREYVMDSLETAMKMAGGRCTVLLDDREEDYSEHYFCKESGFTLGEITPRCFSFNNPDGACETCDGLGVTKNIDPALLVPNDDLSIDEGAIHIWSKSGGKHTGRGKCYEALQALARRHKFSLNTPVKKLSAEHIRMIFYGEPDDASRDAFAGIVPELEERYRNTKSEYMRRELERFMTERQCPQCKGKRLKQAFLAVTVNNRTIDEYVTAPLPEFMVMVREIAATQAGSSEAQRMAVRTLTDEMLARAQALCDVGVDYLTLSRSSHTLSGGEAQRIRLAVQIKSDLTGVIYVLDEPTAGLHSRDTRKLLAAMQKLQKARNTLIVVEHDADIMRAADWVIDMGPGAGDEGGQLVFAGTLAAMKKANTKTAQYLTKKLRVAPDKKKRAGSGKSISVIGATEHNLKNITVEFPLGTLTAVCGVSGSGKSTLVHTILSRVLAQKFHRAATEPGAHRKVTGLSGINKVITIDQAPIGRTPRSNTATYTGVFTHIRDLFAATERAQEKKLDASYFSFNMRGGRCEVCRGDGLVKVEMHMLPDMYVPCEECAGRRYNSTVLEIEYNGVTIADVLDMSVDYAYAFFKNHHLIAEKLRAMRKVGLGYITLGQSATNLSGGEAQRVKLATELARKSTGKTLYILDEPTTGLHFDDTKKLLLMLDELVQKGNTVIVVEHNTDVIMHADWVIELGPDGGAAGGQVVFAGTPQDLKKVTDSPTARFL